MVWRPAKSLVVLHNQLRPLAPGADPRSWGLKGDDNHNGTSDHAPKDFPGWGYDIVTAADFPKHGSLNPRAVLESIRRSRDSRVKYAISERQMFSSYPAHGYKPFTWRPYANADRDPHDTHGHLSVVGDARADDTRPWAIEGDGELSSEASDIVKFELRPWLADTAHAVGRIEQAVAHLAETFGGVTEDMLTRAFVRALKQMAGESSG